MAYAQADWYRENLTEHIVNATMQELPLYHFLQEQEPPQTYAQTKPSYDMMSALQKEQELWQSVQSENEAALQQESEAEQPTQTADTQETAAFIPATDKSAVYLEQQLAEPEFIRQQFYTVDATTDINLDKLRIDKLLGFDATLQQDATQPQILIYHTHSQETYADSVAGDASTSILGVGEYLSAILRQQYGYNVLHHMGLYDVESRDYAYSNAAKGLEQVLAENPSIEVIIDLHRDEMQEGVRLVTQLQGRATAKFMFFNGLSYTRERGEITTLPNPYIQENLSFAFQMKLAADEYYPGLTRKSYLKGYRYNLQYRPKSLLVELGAQTNTLEEAMNACPLLAHILDMVLKGELSQQ